MNKPVLSRTAALLKADIRFQFRYGFYFLYLAFTVLYLGLLALLPGAWREKAGIVMIFTDPAAMGLFFMGAIVLFEKSEHVLDSLAISPAQPEEYVMSKLISIALISTAVGLLIGFGSGSVKSILFLTIGIFLSSCLFSSVGLIIAAKIKTLNQFLLATVPAEIVFIVPAVVYLLGYREGWMLFHPGVCAMELFTNGSKAVISIFVLLLWTVLFYLFACRTVIRMMQSVGGIKL